MRNIWNLPFAQWMPFAEIEEKRLVLLVTSAPAWKAVKDRLRLHIAAQIEISEASTQDWDKKLLAVRGQEFAAIYAVGGGLAADAAKYFALRLNLPLSVLPTALSADAFLTARSAIRRAGVVSYLETRPPENLVLDLDVIASAPAAIRAAGITDLLSIATGAWDWKFAQEHDKNPPGMEFIPWAHENAHSILNGALDCAEAAGRGDRDGLKTLYDCLALEVQLCNQLGHTRPEVGSEHYFAYAVENRMGAGLPHADLVGPGIMIMAMRQEQGKLLGRLESALHACQVRLNGIPENVVEETLHALPAYCQKYGLAYGIAHELERR